MVSNKVFRIMGHEERAVRRRPEGLTKRVTSEKSYMRTFTQHLWDNKPCLGGNEKRIEIHANTTEKYGWGWS